MLRVLQGQSRPLFAESHAVPELSLALQNMSNKSAKYSPKSSQADSV